MTKYVKPISFAYIDTALGLFITLERLNRGDQTSTRFLIRNSDRVIYDTSKKYLRNQLVDYCSNLSFKRLFKLVVWSYRNNIRNIFLPDVGLKNKLLIVFFKCEQVYIVDDGSMSLSRKKIDFSYISFFSKVFSSYSLQKNISYCSLYQKAYPEQLGEFNISLADIFKKNNFVFKDKLFYICSMPTKDGMSFNEDNFLTEKLIKHASFLGKDLLILPHRRDRHKVSENYKHNNYVFNTNTAFEEFYYLNRFENCYFLTLYSGAIFSVSKSDNPGYLRNYFSPIIEQTFISKALGKDAINNFDINRMFDSLDIKPVFFN